GTLISEVTMNPGTYHWKQWDISIEQGWLEKCKSGGYYLCFRIANGKDAVGFAADEGGYFVMDDKKESLKHIHAKSWIQVVRHLESDDLSNLRFSFIGSLKDMRPKDIRFTVKNEAR